MSSEENSLNDNTSQPEAFAVKFADPEGVVDKIEIASGSIVADFGCASGYFSLPVAKKIGEEGVVYALDILPQNLETVNSKAKTASLTNIITKKVNLEKENGSGLPDDSCDWVIMKCILFQNKNKSAILTEAKRVLKSGGKVLLIEWNMSDSSIGPDMSLRISKEALSDIIQLSGLSIAQEVPVGDFHYSLVLIK